jgi:nucleotide-binding universal stress UspA family protein
MYGKIIVPLDGSRLSELALPHAKAIARQFNSEILLVRVCQPTPVPFELYTLGQDVTEDYVNAVHDQAETDARSYLVHLHKRLRLQNIRTRYFVPGGIVTDSILDIADSESVDLIVMSTHGRSGLSRWVYGSVASKVLQVAPCPVLLVRAQCDQAENPGGT